MALALRPVAFFAGFIAGFAALSLLGEILVPRHLVTRFVRIYNEIAIDSYFYPTAREFRAIVDAPVNPKPRVTVIIGGTSVLQGESQYSKGIWSEHLKEILGPDYRVINLAQLGGNANEGGNLAAEMLLKEHRPVIYVCDSMIWQFTIPMERSLFYRKVVFDAWSRGMLLRWPARDRLMERALWSPISDLRDTAWGSILDVAANARDFWNWVYFEVGGTIWNPQRGGLSFTPLRQYSDGELPPDWYEKRGYVQGETLAMNLQFIRDYLFPDDNETWKAFVNNAEAQIPPQLRAVSLVTVDLFSPHVLDMLEPSEKAAFLHQGEHVTELLKGIGFARTMIPATDFDEHDYTDIMHLSVTGGRKLAEAVAPQVVKLAHSLGYFDGVGRAGATTATGGGAGSTR